MNTITQSGQYLESLSLITDTSKYLGIANDAVGIVNDVGLAKISTGYFGAIITVVDTLIPDQITTYYQKPDKDTQRQVTNPGAYIQWQLKDNKMLNKGLIKKIIINYEKLQNSASCYIIIAQFLQ